ncbi:MAG: ribonuclease III [Clostridia bacterium]|nr:ribonuclease III [Clostridia bacterium]
MALPLEELQGRIDYRFRDVRYLSRAVTHSSYSNETGARNHHLLCNERLEFLGDSVLSLITSNYLYSQFPDYPEGDLTRMRAATVCEEALASYANRIGLGEFLLLGKGEGQSGGAKKPAILADAFEAMLAAIYLDAGQYDGLKAVSAFLLPFIKKAVSELPEMGGSNIDSKSRLQEFVQQDKEQKETLEYRLIGESGPDHNKTFVVELYLGANCIGTGEGHSKKNAEQAAARAALRLFGQV